MNDLVVEPRNAEAGEIEPPAGGAHGEQILIVDDTPANLDLLAQVLEPHGYRILAAPGAEIALSVAKAALPDLIIMDVMMPGIDGYEASRRLRADAATSDIPILFVSARDETASLLEAFAAGGVDYLTKPFDADEILIRVQTHLKVRRLSRQLQKKNNELAAQAEKLLKTNEALRSEIAKRQKAEDALQVADEKLSGLSEHEAERWGISAFVGKSPTIQKILSDVRRLQNFASVNVLITGESGTGKELVARAIHFGSGRGKGPFIAVNCVAIPTELAESMFFGHVRGAFTGATIDRKGYFELADGGTLFLDEIGDMPAALQAKLLRVLEDGKVTPLGSTRERSVAVRIVAATNADLERQIDGGVFRQDLYFRLAQFAVELPPLRDRKEDIPSLAIHFMKLFATEMGIEAPRVHPEVLQQLSSYPFPGNVRELKNVIERALIESGDAPVQLSHLHLGNRKTPPPLSAGEPSRANPIAAADEIAALPLNLEAAENALIKRALAETNGNIAEAARRLGINRTRIYRKLAEGHDET